MKKVKNDGYVNYGDVNPLEYGGFFMKKVGEGQYSIVYFMPLEDREGYNYFTVCALVDINDEWIDWEEVSSFTGLCIPEASEADKAYCAFQTYETEFSNGESEIIEHKKYLKAFLRGYGIISGLE